MGEIDEKTRLDLRRAFEELIGPELAAAAMEAMPNIDYDKLATKTDLAELRLATTANMTQTRVELRGEMIELRADMRTEMAQLRGALETRMATNMRITVLTHVASIFAVGGVFAGFS